MPVEILRVRVKTDHAEYSCRRLVCSKYRSQIPNNWRVHIFKLGQSDRHHERANNDQESKNEQVNFCKVDVVEQNGAPSIALRCVHALMPIELEWKLMHYPMSQPKIFTNPGVCHPNL